MTDWRKRQQEAWTILRWSRLPHQGIFYWLPRRRGGWRLSVWLAATNEPDALRHISHIGVWAEVIEHLSYEWRLSVDLIRDKLSGQFAALPRGRVGFTHKGYWVIGRGTEVRVPNDVGRLYRAFHLNPERIQIIEDDHWDELPSEKALIDELLWGTR